MKADLWSIELKEMRIKVNDFKDDPIDILIVTDIAGKLNTGKKRDFKCGIVADKLYLTGH